MAMVCVRFGYAALISSSASTTYLSSSSFTPLTMFSLSISLPVRLLMRL